MTNFGTITELQEVISTHILTRRMTNRKNQIISIWIFQLTSSRGGWLCQFQIILCYTTISTHILTRRMTPENRYWISPFIFQLTSSRGGWQCKWRIDRRNKHFNSHPHEEDDRTDRTWRYQNWNFNSHPHEEDDKHSWKMQKSKWHFNSHPHEEDDDPGSSCMCRYAYFNSHPHEEDDEFASLFVFQFCISTHILTRRMTGVCGEIHAQGNISTHILTRRMTVGLPKDVRDGIFQLTSSRGGWLSRLSYSSFTDIFQLTSSRGGWPFGCKFG